MYVLGHTFNTQPGSSQLCLSLHFLLAQNLKASRSWEVKAFSGLSWACAQTYACRWPSRFSGIYWSFSKLPVNIAFLSSSSSRCLCLCWQHLQWNWDFVGCRKQLLLWEVNGSSHVGQLGRLTSGLIRPQEAERSPSSKWLRPIQATLSWHLPCPWAICCLLSLMTTSFLFPHNLYLLMAYQYHDLLASAPIFNWWVPQCVLV